VKNRIRLVRPSISGMKRIFNFGLPIVISNVLGTVVNNVAILVLGLFVVAAVVGNIGIAQNANALFNLVTVSISVSLIQLFSTVLKSNKAKHRIGDFFSNSVYYAFVFVAPLIFFVAILAKPFSYVAFGGVYNLAPLYIRFTSIGLLLGLAGAYATSLIISTGNTKQVLKYNAFIVAVQLLLVFALIPILKGIGFVLTFFVITPVLMDILFVRYAIKKLKVGLKLGRLFRVLTANILGTLPLYLLIVVFGGNYVPLLIVGVITTLLAYPLALSALKGIERKDMENLRKFSSDIPVVSSILNLLLDYAALLL
jgi:O-antigen/teichoic acid export membrane protein